ncbi:putative E3 ubiquitin ligase complex SCF subunit sconB [Smittium culicis]|uniref:Putative E3 ubiquitin ligase complex SCF subunit sconB n=1 Tax=Smittium culicis TaxID=133412 RepID=A0A1R1YSK0_9FUNG|nr:putative E3 ubiquitin ligase complex SCF subunit sconB [Smittium culicis]
MDTYISNSNSVPYDLTYQSPSPIHGSPASISSYIEKSSPNPNISIHQNIISIPQIIPSIPHNSSLNRQNTPSSLVNNSSPRSNSSLSDFSKKRKIDSNSHVDFNSSFKSWKLPSSSNKYVPELEKLDPESQEKIVSFWNTFTTSSSEIRMLLLEGVVNNACVKQLSYLNKVVPQNLRIDFISSTPPEIAIKILSYLDAKTLCVAAKVSKTWARYANDNLLWHRMCVQHIDKICNKCGWGLPLLHPKNNAIHSSTNSITNYNLPAQSKCISNLPFTDSLALNANPSSINISSHNNIPSNQVLIKNMHILSNSIERENGKLSNSPLPSSKVLECSFQNNNTKSWKKIFSERQTVAINWKKMRYRKIVYSCQNSEICYLKSCNLYVMVALKNGNIIVSDGQTGDLINTLVGHTEPVTSVCYDECKLISGSTDGTVKIWCYRTGACIRTIRPSRNSGVTSLAIIKRQLAIGSCNGSVSVFDFNLGKTFHLSGHDDKVNELVFYNDDYLFSCSDDLTVKRWDLKNRACTHIYNGHSCSIGSISLNITASLNKMTNGSIFIPKLFSASLDGTIRVWDIDTGKCTKILCYHSEPVWSIASDAFHLISSHNDGKVCIWDSDSLQLLHVITPTDSIVSSLSLTDSRVDCGDKSGNVTIFDFKNLN